MRKLPQDWEQRRIGTASDTVSRTNRLPNDLDQDPSGHEEPWSAVTLLAIAPRSACEDRLQSAGRLPEAGAQVM